MVGLDCGDIGIYKDGFDVGLLEGLESLRAYRKRGSVTVSAICSAHAKILEVTHGSSLGDLASVIEGVECLPE